MNPIAVNPVRRSLVSLTAALALVVGLTGPAAANAAGFFTSGTAVVGKVATFCTHAGRSDVSGAGIGLPGLTQPKQAFYWLKDITVTVTNDPTKGVKAGVSTGTLNACGRLRWINKLGGTPPPVGAACGMNKGYAGKGRINYTSGPKVAAGFPHNTYSLHNITWKLTAGGSIPFTASGSQGVLAKGAKGPDLVTGTINAQPVGGAAACLTKAGDGAAKTGGAIQFTVNGEFKIVNGAWTDPQSPGLGTLESPGICKNTGNPLCAYDTKQPQTPKTDG